MKQPIHGPRQLLALALLTPLLGCGDSPIEPVAVPGTLTLSLNTPHDDDRGLILEVSGPGTASSVQALGDYRVHARVSAGSFRAAVFGDIQDGAVLTFHVPDVGRAEEYTAVVREAAAASSELRPGAAAYTIEIGR